MAANHADQPWRNQLPNRIGCLRLLTRQEARARRARFCGRARALPRPHHRWPAQPRSGQSLARITVWSFCFADSYIPSSNDAHGIAWFELKDDLERSSADGVSQQLVAITVRLVAPYLEVSEEALYRFTERYMMGGQLVALEVISKSAGVKRCQLTTANHPFLRETTGHHLTGLLYHSLK